MKLRTKLVAWYSAVFLLSAGVLVTAMYEVIAHKLVYDFYHYLDDEFEEAQRITQDNLSNLAELRNDMSVEIVGNRYFPMSYRLYDARARREVVVMAPEWQDALKDPPATGGAGERPVRTSRQVSHRARDIVYFMTGNLAESGHPELSVEIGMSFKRVYKRILSLRKVLIGSLGLSLIVAVAGGWLLAYRSLRPIDRMAAALEHIEAEKLSQRLAEAETGDEVGRLAGSINRTLGRLEKAFEATRSFAADAAHELRTPLAALRCRLETAAETGDVADLRQAAQDCLRLAGELSRLIDNVLLLARLDAEEVSRETECICMGDVLEDVREIFEALAEERGVELALGRADDCSVRGNRVLLRRLVSNLIENAILYTPAGGQVKVGCTHDGPQCRLAVADTGVGLEPEERAQVFTRFYRAHASGSQRQGGAGLGLSIAQRIVELHAGTIAMDSEKGVGTTVTVSLPADQSTPA